MRSLPLGQSLDDKRPVALPLDYATQVVGVIARRGAGKTYCAKNIAEGLLAHHLQTIIFDPLDVWWGLRMLPDGKPSAFSRLVIFGGRYADLPLIDTAGVAIADLIINEGLSAILSTRHLTGRGQTRFAQDFAEQLYRRKAEEAHRTPIHLMLDEADSFIPQRPMPEEQRMLGAFDKMVRYGRASGIGVTMVTQRPAVLNKNALSQAEMLIVLQITGPQDRKAVKEWVDAHDTGDKAAEFLAGLAGLKRGEAWLWSPAWLDIFERVNIRKATTFDSSYTPKVGELGKAQKPPAKIDSVQLEGWKSKLAEVVAEAEASDPSKLKAKIRELQASVERLTSRAPVVGVDAADAERRLAVAVQERKATLEDAEKVVDQLLAHVTDSTKQLQRAVQSITERALVRWQQVSAALPKTAKQVSIDTGRIPRTQAPARVNISIESFDPTLTKCERAILVAAVQRHPRPSTRVQLSVVSGYSQNSSSFKNALSGLRVKELLQESMSGLFHSTPGGIAAAGDVDPAPFGEKLIRWWVMKLEKCPAELLEAIFKSDPGGIKRLDLADVSDYSPTSSSFKNGLSRLRVLGLIEQQGEFFAINPEILEP